MFSEELTTYLYSYNMPQKEKKEPGKKKNDVEVPIVNILKKAYVTAPVNFHHEMR